MGLSEDRCRRIDVGVYDVGVYDAEERAALGNVPLACRREIKRALGACALAFCIDTEGWIAGIDKRCFSPCA
jgi:hypothetical protein